MSFQQLADPLSANTISGLTETFGLVLTALCAALFASGSFLLLALGFIVAFEMRLGVPSWLIIGTAVPVAFASIWIAVCMFQRTLEVERSLTRGTNRLGVLSEETVVDTSTVPKEWPGAPR